jgi:hypothetical protein
MKKSSLSITVAFLLAVITLWTVSCKAGDAGYAIPDYTVTAEDKAYVSSVKDAILKDNKEWLADQLRLPLLTVKSGHKLMINSKENFLVQYDKIINPYVHKQVADQDPENVFKNYAGFMIGGTGAIWVSQACDDKGTIVPSKYCIITVNNGPPVFPR